MWFNTNTSWSFSIFLYCLFLTYHDCNECHWNVLPEFFAYRTIFLKVLCLLLEWMRVKAAITSINLTEQLKPGLMYQVAVISMSEYSNSSFSDVMTVTRVSACQVSVSVSALSCNVSACHLDMWVVAKRCKIDRWFLWAVIGWQRRLSKGLGLWPCFTFNGSFWGNLKDVTKTWVVSAGHWVMHLNG